MDWRTNESFPKANGHWQYWRPPFGRKRSGETQVKRAIWQWHPWDPVLIATPISTYFMPPICVPEIAEKVHKRMLSQYKLLMFIISIIIAIMLALCLDNRSLFFGRMATAGIMLLAFISLQYTFIFKNIDAICQTSRFVAWVYLQKNISSGLP